MLELSFNDTMSLTVKVITVESVVLCINFPSIFINIVQRVKNPVFIEQIEFLLFAKK